MRVGGDSNPTHEVYAGERWSEKGNPQYEVEVVETTPFMVTYRYPDGEEYTDPVPEFLSAFTQDPGDDVDITGGL